MKVQKVCITFRSYLWVRGSVRYKSVQSIPKRNLWAPCVCGVESLYLFQIAKCGAIQILVRMLQTTKDNEEKLNACNAFWTLAFDEENQMEIKANEQAISELEKLLTDENIEIQRAAAGALWECNGKERYAEEKKQKVGLQQITGTCAQCAC